MSAVSSSPAGAQGRGAPLHPRLLLGTSSWSSKDWEGVFYPAGMPPGEYLAYYAGRYRTVEVDATFYRIPSPALVRKWIQVLPGDFLLAAKVPQVITHEKILENCGAEWSAFLQAMETLGDRLGPLLLQFPYFRKGSPTTPEVFVERLRRFLPLVPSGRKVAIEVRNKSWLKPPLLDLLRAHGAALALIDHPWMPKAAEYLERDAVVTADFCYVRWLGDRYKIEQSTKTWNKAIVDRTREMRAWVPVVRKLLEGGGTVFGYFNNHYAGHAPASIELFERIWREGPDGPPRA